MKLFRNILQKLKKFFGKSETLSISSEIDVLRELEQIRHDFSILEKEITRLEADNKVFLQFCKDTLIDKIRYIDSNTKLLVSHDDQIIELNRLLTQHAECINSFLMQYQEHLVDTTAHSVEVDIIVTDVEKKPD